MEQIIDDTEDFTIELTEPEPEKKTNWLLILAALGLAYRLLKR